MAIVKMHKITMIGMEKEKNDIIENLMDIGVLHINDIGEDTYNEELAVLFEKDENHDEILQLNSDIEKIKTSLEYLKQHDKQKKPLFSPKRSIDLLNYGKINNTKKELMKLVEEINNIDAELTGLKLEKNKLDTSIASLDPWKSMKLPLEVTNTKTSTIMRGVIPLFNDIDDFLETLNKEIPESIIQVVNRDKEQIYLIVICHKFKQEELLMQLNSKDFEKIDFGDMSGSIEQNISDNKHSIKKILEEMDSLKEKISFYVSERENIEVMFDDLNIQKDRKEALGRLLKTQSTFLLEGWVPETKITHFKKDILKYQDDCYIDIEEAGEDEEFPILLENNKVVQPFELITELYSLPNTKEMDPNPYMAPFFFVFFGLMLSDAGYGLLISILSGIVIYKFKPKGTMNNMLKLMFLCGVSTFLWGVLFGGWFGDVMTQITSGKINIKPLWFNPMDDPMKLLLWSFIFGGIQLFTAMAVKGIDSIRKGRILDAILDVIPWYTFLIGIALLFVGGEIGNIGKYISIVGVVLLIFTQGRAEKNIFKKLFKGVASLYDTVGFMSDILSYSRLLALGLATGVIASVINTIGLLFGFNIIGIIIFIFTFIAGHTFNLMINALGAFVHASRLQYVEFFGKFYEGGGRPYQPLKINTKYININVKEEGNN